MVKDIFRKIRYTIYSYMPKGLFKRAITIILVPLIFVQLTLFWVFNDRIWDSVLWRLSSSIAGDINQIIELVQNNEKNAVYITENSQKNLRITALFKPHSTLPKIEKQGTSLEENMYRALNEFISYPSQVDVSSAPDYITVYVQVHNRVMEFKVHKTRFYAISVYILFGWVFISSILLATISVLFMRNQVRPIQRLAIAMERLGRNSENNPSLKPHGALEVRQAARAFNKMKDRIERHVRQRTDMLSGISHDLRTPLTRMKLQLSMMEKTPDIDDLLKDIAEMENMVNTYLDFVKDNGKEDQQSTNISQLIDDTCRNWQRQGKTVSSSIVPDIITELKPHAFTRCLNNLIGNSCQYASQVTASLTINDKNNTLIIHVDDNGPGIPESERHSIFQPFERLETARNQNTAGVGLGLSIVRNIISAHGGDITLHDSPMGGLRVTIILPQ